MPHHLPQEIKQCNQYLTAEINEFVQKDGMALLALGTVAHQAALMSARLKLKDYPFGHGAVHHLSLENDVKLYDSYHCSRYNTQTKRLTAAMFEQVFEKIVADMKR